MKARAPYTIALPGRAPLQLGARTLVMGVINVTPDSFSDGGVRFNPSRAVEDGLRMVSEGARLSSTEMALFELLRVAGTEEFRAISRLVK